MKDAMNFAPLDPTDDPFQNLSSKKENRCRFLHCAQAYLDYATFLNMYNLRDFGPARFSINKNVGG
jgi:hypothetical protein